MKRFIITALILLFTASTVTVFAAGDKNRGTTGSGTTSTGQVPREPHPSREPADNYPGYYFWQGNHR